MDPLFTLTFKIFLAAVLLAGAVKKLTNQDEFRSALKAFVVNNAALEKVLRVSVPVGELTIAMALLVPMLSTYAVWAAVGVIVLYTLTLSLAFIRGKRDFDCGCTWGANSVPAQPILLIRNVVLLGAAFAAAVPEVHRELLWFDGLNALLAAVVLTILYVALETLLTLPNQISERQTS